MEQKQPKTPGKRVDEIVDELMEGRIKTLPMHNWIALEMIKRRALPIMGPLFVTVDIRRERYIFRRDTEREYLINSDRWY